MADYVGARDLPTLIGDLSALDGGNTREKLPNNLQTAVPKNLNNRVRI